MYKQGMDIRYNLYGHTNEDKVHCDLDHAFGETTITAVVAAQSSNWFEKMLGTIDASLVHSVVFVQYQNSRPGLQLEEHTLTTCLPVHRCCRFAHNPTLAPGAAPSCVGRKLE
eukprot:jgi/Botrbrau1/4738/Bobra.0137s0010.1